MRRGRRAALIGLGIAAVVCVGLIGGLALKPGRPVTVVVRNDSEKSIARVRIEHERGVEAAENIATGEARTMKFIGGGESSYTLHVRFADGSEVSSSPRYAESGYEVVETVSGSGIKTDAHLPRY